MLPLSFYILSIVFIILVTVAYGRMNMYIASCLVLLYVMYSSNYFRYICCLLKSERDLKSKLRLLGSLDSTIEVLT